MRKILSLAVAAAMALSLAACGASKTVDSTAGSTSESSEAAEAAESAESAGTAEESAEETKPDTITISALDAAGEPAEIEVPYDPERIAILDFAALDAIDNLGLGDRVVGCASTTLDYLMSYNERDDVALLGTIKEADLEAVMACEPDIIFIGGRLSASYDALAEIAPVVYLATDSELGVVESTRVIATTIASIFGLDDEIAEKMAGFDARIEALAAVAEGNTAVVGMCTSGSFNLLGNDGRCSIIGREIGFENIGVTATESGESSGEGRGQGGGSGEGRGQGGGGQGGATATHGNEASFELIVSLAPDYIFVMDRDAAIGTDGAQLAPEIMENELVMGTDAYQNGRLVYLAHPAAWYTAEGGITALDYMLQDLEASLL